MMISKRLQTIVDLIDKDLNLVDIGTDHGIVPVEVLNNNYNKKIIATDINPKPLSRAESFIKQNNFEGKVDLRVGSGLKPININEADQILVAGMGGELIADILKSDLDKAKYAKQMILQPMTKVEELRKFLIDNGFNISKDIVIEDNQSKQIRYFHILVVNNDKGIDYGPFELIFGPTDQINISQDYKHYIKRKIDQYEKRIASMNNSDNFNTIRRRLEYERRLKFLIEVYESTKNC